MEWIHCNKCNIRIGQEETKFHLTQCGKLICEKCKNPSQCIFCKKPNCGTVLLSNDLDSHVKMYFMPFENLLKNIVDVNKFQSQQRLRFSQLMCYKYSCLKKEWARLEGVCKRLAQENQSLKKQLRNESPASRDTSTPASRCSRLVPSPSLSSIHSALTPIPQGYPPRSPGFAMRVYGRTSQRQVAPRTPSGYSTVSVNSFRRPSQMGPIETPRAHDKLLDNVKNLRANMIRSKFHLSK